MGLIDHENIGHSAGNVVAKLESFGFRTLIALVMLLVTLYFLAISVYRIWFHPLSKFPGPYLMSAIYTPFLYRNYIKGNFIKYVTKLHAKYGTVVRIGPNHLSVDGSAAWPDIYSHRKGGKEEFVRPRNFFFLNDEDSIIGALKDNHRRIRRQLAHGFSDAALKEQEHVIKEYIDLLFDRLDGQAQRGNAVDMVQWLNFTTFDIIGDLAFNDSFHSLSTSDYHPWVLSVFRGIQGNALDRFLRYYPFLKTASNFFSLKLLKVRDENRTQSFTKAKVRMELGAEPKDMRRDFMSYMMKKNRDGHQGMTTNEILLSAPILIIAGSETTATAVSGMLFNLAQTPEVLKNLVDEVRSTFEKEEDITIRTASSLPYLHACIEENLRLYPPAAEISVRVSPGDFVDGQYVPKGTLLNTYPWATFHNPKNFTDVEKFCPQRWLPETHSLYESRFSSDNLAAFKPFSYGPRDCIGKNLAYAEMRLIVSRFMYRFDYRLLPGQEDWQAQQRAFVLWDKGPLRIQLEKREVE